MNRAGNRPTAIEGLPSPNGAVPRDGIPWPAVMAVARADIRAGWRLFVALGVLVGLLAGAALTSAQVARRTATAYDRLVATVGLDDARLVVPNPSPQGIADLGTLPGVQASAMTVGWVGQVLGHGVNYLDISAAVTPSNGLVQPVIVGGRAADPASVDEIILGEPVAAATGLGVGDSIDVALLTTEEISQFDVGFGAPDGPTVPLRIVGIGRLPVWGNGVANAAATPAFAATYRDSAAQLTAFFRLNPDQTSAVAFADAAAAFIDDHPTAPQLVALGPARLSFPAAELDVAVQTAAQFLQVGLLVFGALLLAAALFLLIGGLLRRTADTRVDQQIEAALGLTRSASVLGRTVPYAGTALLAGVICAVVGLSAAGLPAAGGLARFEPTPGFLPNGGLIAVGGLAVAAAVVLVAAVVIRVGLRPVELGASGRSTEIPDRLWSTAELTAGVRFARGSAPTRWPAVGRILGIALGISGVLAAATFGASLDRTVDSPERWGWTADAVVFDVKPEQLTQLSADPRVADLDLIRNSTLDVGTSPPSAQTPAPGSSDSFTAYGFEHLSGALPWWLIEGRLPQSAGEVAVGTVLADKYALAVGSTWQLPGGADEPGSDDAGGSVDSAEVPRPVTNFSVVGIVSPLAQLRDALGDSAVFTMAGLEAVGGVSASDSAYVRAVPGAAGALLADLAAGAEILTPARPAQIADLADIRLLPATLAVILAAVSLLSVAVLVVSGSRRRAADLAVLAVLGCASRQRRAILLLAAAATIVPALVIGIPVGIGLGRLLWSGLARASGVGGEAIVPWWLAAGFALLTIGVAALSVVLVGSRLGPVTQLLRSE
ncbi:MAG: FtsX-like permease family protein [Nakamurella sp.]